MLYVWFVFVAFVAVVMTWHGYTLILDAQTMDWRSRVIGVILLAGVPWVLLGYYSLWRSE